MTEAELALERAKKLAFLMTERFSMNPISAKLLNEAWRLAFPDEVAVARRMRALVEALEKAQRNANLTEAERQAYLGLISKRDERIAELESRTVKLPDDAEHDIMAPVAAYLSEKFKWDGGAARWDGRKEYDVLADRVKYALRMVIRRAAGIKWEAE